MELFAADTPENTSHSPAWLRARITAIEKLLEKLPSSEEKNPARTLLRNGYIHEQVRDQFETILDSEYKLTFALNEPLSFRDLTSFNTWFTLYPEKVCGKEVVTTSLQFPITIRGTKEDIIRCLGQKKDKKGIKKGQKRDKNGIEKDQNGIKRDKKGYEMGPNDQNFDQNEAKKGSKRFGDSAQMLDWMVSYFHSFYREQVDEFNMGQKPLDEKIETLEQAIIDAKGDKTRRKELIEQFNQAVMLRSDLWRDFESEWLSFCRGLYDIINVRARKLGIDISDDDFAYLGDDIFLAFCERPGIETYWNNTISEVIDNELKYYLKQGGNENQQGNELEMEALALEVELQLLKLK